MRFDDALVGALVAKCQHSCPQVPVYRVRQCRVDELERAAAEMAARFGELAGYAKLRRDPRRYADHSVIALQEGITARVFHASGTVLIDRGWSPMSHVLASNAGEVDLASVQRTATEAIHRMHLVGTAAPEDLRFERLWRLKATGITRQGERGQVVMTRAVVAFRRFLEGLPVWGRASVTVEVAARGQIAGAGVEWREVVGEPIASACVLSPEEGAARVLGELQTYWPGGRYTLSEYTPELFALGYFSMPKRRHQDIMQPAFVAMLKPTGPIPSIGRLIVVPAAPHAYEPIARAVVGPRVDRTKPRPHRTPAAPAC